jgi:hypothetical protein
MMWPSAGRMWMASISSSVRMAALTALPDGGWMALPRKSLGWPSSSISTRSTRSSSVVRRISGSV